MKNLLLLFLFTSYAFAINSEVRFDMLTIQLKKQIQSNNYKKAILTFDKIRQYKKKLPISYDYYEGKANFEAQNYDKAYTMLDKYVSKVGRNGKNYKKSLPMLIDIEELKKKQKISLKEENEIKKRNIYLDKMTGLIWQNTKELYSSTFLNSKKYCNELQLMGYNDWYLPNLSELKTIINNQNNQNLQKAFKDMEKSKNIIFWADTEKNTDLGVWTINFDNLYIEHISKLSTNKYNTRCVRSDQ